MNLETWWLSFCDPNKPEGDQFLGVIVIPSSFMNRLLSREEAESLIEMQVN